MLYDPEQFRDEEDPAEPDDQEDLDEERENRRP